VPQAYAEVSALQLQLEGSLDLQDELDYLRGFLHQLASVPEGASSGGSSAWDIAPTPRAVGELEQGEQGEQGGGGT
jgi:hypothetical protein